MIRSYFLSFVLLCVVLGAYTAVVLNSKTPARLPTSMKKLTAPEASHQEAAAQESQQNSQAEKFAIPEAAAVN